GLHILPAINLSISPSTTRGQIDLIDECILHTLYGIRWIWVPFLEKEIVHANNDDLNTALRDDLSKRLLKQIQDENGSTLDARTSPVTDLNKFLVHYDILTALAIIDSENTTIDEVLISIFERGLTELKGHSVIWGWFFMHTTLCLCILHESKNSV